ncbi:hypothetical protein ACRQ5I_05525 [Pseudoramibacter alactolyticus]|uniref:hypothetical protein n=1 Tax=Pseudoramibacter alactolyticus TaxID=113287 RepID=UPI0012E9D856
MGFANFHGNNEGESHNVPFYRWDFEGPARRTSGKMRSDLLHLHGNNEVVFSQSRIVFDSRSPLSSSAVFSKWSFKLTTLCLRYFPDNKKRPFGPFIDHQCFLKRGRFQPIARRFRLALPTILLGGF